MSNHGCQNYRRTISQSRRDWLTVGSLTGLGLCLGDLLRMKSARADRKCYDSSEGPAKGLIQIVCQGGIAAQESWNPKPEAALGYRGPVRHAPRHPIAAGIMTVLLVGCASVCHCDDRYAFIVAGDTQYVSERSRQPTRLDPYSQQASERFFEIVGGLPGTDIPARVGGGRVSDNILGMIVTGDLIDSADKTGGPYPAMQALEWARFKSDLGLNGQGGKIPWPVYELHGNHDGPQGDTFIIEDIIDRNKRRAGVVNVSANGLHYAWDWGPLHCINAGIFVGLGDERRDGHHYASRASLEFVRDDLAVHVGGSGRPVIISFHLHPNCPEFDWPQEDLSALWKIAQRYNVIALFHGHTHGSPPSRMVWNGKEFHSKLDAGIDVFNPDDAAAAKTDPRDPAQGVGLLHGFLYVELIDRPGSEADQFVVRSYASKDNWVSHDWHSSWSKSIRVPDG